MSHHEDTPSLSSLTCGLSAVGPLLDSCGYAVLDGLLPSCFALALRDEMTTLHRQQLLRPHRFGFKSSPSAPVRLVRKPHIYEAELSEPHVREHAASIGTVSELVATAAGAAFPELQLCPGPNGEGTAVKLQCNEGHGGCFPLHFDNAGPPSCRKLTCLVYLNPHWQPADGGELELVPWLAPPVRIPPLGGRVVLFRSDLVLHRVLPSRVCRFCFTIWIDGARTNEDKLVLPKSRSPREVCAELGRSGAQRLLSRAVYADEYEASLAACMASTQELCSEMVAQHRAHVAACDASGPLAKLVHAAREIKGELKGETAEIAGEIAGGPTAPSVAAAVPPPPPPPPPPSDASEQCHAQLQPATRAGTAGGEAPSVESNAEAHRTTRHRTTRHRTARAASSALAVRLSVCACSDSLLRASVLVL